MPNFSSCNLDLCDLERGKTFVDGGLIYAKRYTSGLSTFMVCTALSLLVGCGANTESASTPLRVTSIQSHIEPSRTTNVMSAFSMSLGSGGNGTVMTELKNHGGQLREPDARYDVFDTESTADLKTLKQNILASLDRDRRVLIDSDGTPESRAKAAQISYEAIGASLPDIGTVLIRKAPEEQGGGFALIPIYSKADVAEQIAQGKLSKPEDLNNAAENFFFEPKQKQP